MCDYSDISTMSDVRSYANRSGHGHWFSAPTMRFFGTRLGKAVYNGPGGVFFVTSERFWRDGSPRLYTVRALLRNGGVDTAGEFQGYATRAAAHRAAKELSQQYQQVAGDGQC